MKKYTDLKFAGDLSFLNEHLEQAITNFNDVLKQEGHQQTSVHAERRTLKETSYQNKEDISLDQNFETSINEKSRRSAINSSNTAESSYKKSYNQSDLTNFTQAENNKNVTNKSLFYANNHKNNLRFEQNTENHMHQSELKNLINKTDFNPKSVNDFKVAPHTALKGKSQLEMMLRNSGFDMTLFNDWKEELLELETENIIMKYKHELISKILKEML